MACRSYTSRAMLAVAARELADGLSMLVVALILISLLLAAAWCVSWSPVVVYAVGAARRSAAAPGRIRDRGLSMSL